MRKWSVIGKSKIVLALAMLVVLSMYAVASANMSKLSNDAVYKALETDSGTGISSGDLTSSDIKPMLEKLNLEGVDPGQAGMIDMGVHAPTASPVSAKSPEALYFRNLIAEAEDCEDEDVSMLANLNLKLDKPSGSRSDDYLHFVINMKLTSAELDAVKSGLSAAIKNRIKEGAALKEAVFEDLMLYVRTADAEDTSDCLAIKIEDCGQVTVSGDEKEFIVSVPVVLFNLPPSDDEYVFGLSKAGSSGAYFIMDGLADGEYALMSSVIYKEVDDPGPTDPEDPDPEDEPGVDDGSGGCSVGFGAFAFLAVIPAIAARRRK